MKTNVRKCRPNLDLVAVDEKWVKGVWTCIQPLLIFCLQFGMNSGQTWTFAEGEHQDISAVGNGLVRPSAIIDFLTEPANLRMKGTEINIWCLLKTERIVNFLAQTTPIDGLS